MENLARLREATINRLSRLPPHRLVQALDFIDFLLERPSSLVLHKPEAPRGNLDDLLACTGIWEFEPGFLFNKPSEVVRMVYAVDHPNFTVLFDSCHAHMCAVVASRQMGEKETLPGGVVQFAHMLTGKIVHIHFIDSDETLHDDETSTHAPFGQGILDFPSIIKAVEDAGYDDEWWPIDLCFWPKALEATEPAKKYMDELVAKYG